MVLPSSFTSITYYAEAYSASTQHISSFHKRVIAVQHRRTACEVSYTTSYMRYILHIICPVLHPPPPPHPTLCREPSPCTVHAAQAEAGRRRSDPQDRLLGAMYVLFVLQTTLCVCKFRGLAVIIYCLDQTRPQSNGGAAKHIFEYMYK